MRSSFAVVVVLAASPAFAGSKTGGGNSDGGGRLGKVSSGIDRATSHPSPPRGGGGGGSSAPSHDPQPAQTTYVDSDDTTYVSTGGGSSYTDDEPPRIWIKPRILVEADGFAGAQKVHESDGSLSLELSVVFQRLFRVNAAVSHYFEPQMDGSRVTLTAPSLTAGIRLGELPKSRLWLEGGVTHVRTNDPAGSSSVTGSFLGARFEHALARNTDLIAQGGGMLFADMQAYTARVAVRFHHVEAAFRYLDFSVGPALYGPEVGFGF
jgi:hypothetical protein